MTKHQVQLSKLAEIVADLPTCEMEGRHWLALERADLKAAR